jgi:aspartate kinase
MRPLVMKFGGTSVADAAAIARVVEIVGPVAARGPVVVVVSAMTRITDDLLRACTLAREGRVDEVDTHVAAIEARHEEAVGGIFRLKAEATSSREELVQQIARHCAELRAVLRSVAVLHELTPRGEDRVVATGELMSSRIVAAALTAAGHTARWVDARRVVVTDDRHPAIPLLDETRVAAEREIRPALDGSEIAVLGGFIGATADGITTTLGRGGSDLSGSVIGAALHAREIQIWTDVDGMLTADPRVVDGAQVVPHLTFDEASELAFFGAKVLHPSTILPAVRDGIPVRILNTRRPDNPGSLITPDAPPAPGALTALACKRNISVVDVTSPRMLFAHGFLRRVFEVFERHLTSVDVVTTSEVSVSMTLDDDRRLEAIVADLRAFAEVNVDTGMAILSAVGNNLQREPHLAVRLIAALDGLPLRMVSQAASRRNLTLVLSDRDLPDAMSRLHQEFFSAVESAR